MAKTTKSVTSAYLLQGAVLALEQCGHLLNDASCLYRCGSYSSALALAALAREERGRAGILFDLRAKVVAGGTVTLEEIKECCEDHITKQEKAVSSITDHIQDKTVGFGKVLDERSRAALGSEERKAADETVRKVDDTRFKRAKHDRHKQRMRALYVDPDESGKGWNRPQSSVSKARAREYLTDAGNDYALAFQKIDPAMLKGRDEHLLQELRDWTDRPTLPPQPKILPIDE